LIGRWRCEQPQADLAVWSKPGLGGRIHRRWPIIRVAFRSAKVRTFAERKATMQTMLILADSFAPGARHRRTLGTPIFSLHDMAPCRAYPRPARRSASNPPAAVP
jgi:hypothetical protein